MTTAKISPNGQISLPKDVRDALGLRAGDRVGFTVTGDTAVLVPLRRRQARDLCGALGPGAADLDVAALREERASHLAAKYRGTDR